MKMKFGALVVDGRGKIGGHVASKNRAGAYLRTKVTPVNPATAAQSLVRSRLASLASGWRALTQTQRNGWNAAVSQFAKTDIFGDIRNPSGVNLYQRLNNNLLGVDESTIDSAPEASEVNSEQLISLTVESGAVNVNLVIANALDAGTKAKIFATPSLSPGINFVKSEYRQIYVADTTDTASIDLTAAYQAKFGAPILDQKVFMKIVFVNIATGQASAEQSLFDIVENAA